MNWQQLLASNRIRPHKTSPAEIGELRLVVERDLRDAAILDLSADRRFATAYNGALQLSKMVLACAGFRATGSGHHQVTFEAVEIAMGEKAADWVEYFDVCRRKRNMADYDIAGGISETEAKEIYERVKRYRSMVENWIDESHPALGRDPA